MTRFGQKKDAGSNTSLIFTQYITGNETGKVKKAAHGSTPSFAFRVIDFAITLFVKSKLDVLMVFLSHYQSTEMLKCDRFEQILVSDWGLYISIPSIDVCLCVSSLFEKVFRMSRCTKVRSRMHWRKRMNKRNSSCSMLKGVLYTFLFISKKKLFKKSFFYIILLRMKKKINYNFIDLNKFS